MSPVADQERTERLAEQHRREIVDAAERLVKGKGLHQLKLRDIAKESGKSPWQSLQLFPKQGSDY